MQKIHLISGVEFNGSSQDDFDILNLEADAGVNEAIARGEIPQAPIHSALHFAHSREMAVQGYLTQAGIPAGLVYQSVFVGFGIGTAVDENKVRKFGLPLIVRPDVVNELSVACLGDLQNVVAELKRSGGAFPVDDRIANLSNAPDRTEALKQLCLRAQEHNAAAKANFVYVEARLNRPWAHSDFVRFCQPSDFWRPIKRRSPFRRVG